MCQQTPEAQIALRQGTRYVARLQHAAATAQHDTAPDPAPTSAFSAAAVYLITGGVGALGMLTANWMAARGARHLVLVSRNAPAPEAARAIKTLAEAGVHVTCMAADVADATQLARVLAHIDRAGLPLRGIIHAAGVLDDGVLLQQTPQRFAHVLAPKVLGAWNLHALTRTRPLDFFILFSSVASLLGSAGQANHAAANAFLDALAHARAAMGLPGLSINWGAWSDVGAAVRQQVSDQWRHRGIDSFTPAQGLADLAQVFSTRAGQVGVVAIHWPRFLATRRQTPYYTDMQRVAAIGLASSAPRWREQLHAAPVYKRRAMLAAVVTQEVAQVLGFAQTTRFEEQQGFFELGLDSLTSIDLRNRLQASLGVTLPPTFAFDFPTIATIIDFLSREFLPEVTSPAEQQPLAGPAAVDDLSQDDIAELLARALKHPS